MRQRARVDSNQLVIVKALRSVGATVEHLHQLGHGVCDLLVLYKERLYLIEIKDGSKPPSQRKLTADEQAWHKRWPVYTVETVADALKVIGLTIDERGRIKECQHAS